MVCIWTDDPEYPFYEQCHAAYETLSNAVDAKGRKLKVYKLCMPVKPLYMDQASCDTIDADENAEPRVPDEPLIASYMNYLVTNHGVIVPQYGDENDRLAVDTLQEIYDEVWGEGVYKCVASSPTRSSTAAATSTASPSSSRLACKSEAQSEGFPMSYQKGPGQTVVIALGGNAWATRRKSSSSW